jgi:hypothetical protein
MRAGTLRWFSKSVSIKPYSSSDGYGASVYGSAVVNAARIVVGQKSLLDDRGNELVSSCQVYVDGTSAVTQTSEITLPDGTKPKILQVKTIYDAVGTAFLKVIFT